MHSEHEVAGVAFRLTRKRMKNIRLRVLANSGLVCVSAPQQVEFAQIAHFITSKQAWILQAQAHIAAEPQEPNLADLEILREPMRAQVTVMLPVWEQEIGVKTSSFGIKKMRTRWGSCNVRTRKIWLSLELADKPPELLEYVLVHELVHLLEASHNARFYRFMDTFMPDWRDKHQRLNPLARRRL
ncbi:M48 family metallopeptidase [Aliidiomarina sp.]|uniref:M48 family metallopeptidase n=1 Tax=Aliidiomarina sp. TaxID=1872439 RepID=UPI003A4DE213